MDFSEAKTRSKRTRKGVKLEQQYSHPLQFFHTPPTDTISLQEFEEYAVERLKVLKALDTAGVRHIRGTEKYTELVEKEIKKTKFGPILRTDRREDEFLRRLDHISHFILRLAYCRSEELRRWFLQQELELLRLRFQRETPESRQEFLRENNLNYSPISDEEKRDITPELIAAAGRNTSQAHTQEYFKVPFVEVLDLISKRKVFLKEGFAYVPREDMISILLTHYRAHLSHSLAVTCRALPHLEEDDRLLPMVCGLSKRYVGQDYTSKKTNVGQITADMVEMLSKQSFPMCMQQLHESMRRDHHLRHGGRQQYGLFLKGIGLSLEEAMTFWRKEFTKLIDGDKFDKNYSYNIRHNYGKEGKRANYTPYSCMKIIMSNAPGQGDFHGCPFKHCDEALLAQKLRAQNLSKDYIDKIMNEVKGGHYGVACTKHFLARHTGVEEQDINSINHPNQYFEESQRILRGDKREVLRPVPNTPRSQYSSQSQGTPKSEKIPDSQGTPRSQMSGIEEMEEDDDLMMSLDC
ncbi:DNA primase large subunit-like [Ylistrum balloti]|uniref:DNA primase large subunit-like n=1 Tax=Ylistrum balloti TaxID=509963 RepID=UPI002905ABAF|nr:DNA primase large subunit-like [Ylistrum balloti]